MLHKNDWQEIVRCPVTHSNLSWLSDKELLALNAKENTSYEGVLKTADNTYFYPMINGILHLLPSTNLDLTQKRVKQFYEEVGWKENNGVYQDAQDSEDLRTISEDYILQCHMRLKKHLPAQGKYLLDVASGPVQYPAYLSYSEGFEYRICADLSLNALLEAKKKLGDKGIYILCDVTQLPLKSDKIDAVVSLHTLYHVPANKQLQAFSEIQRVLKPKGTSIIVYSWGRNSVLMNFFLFPHKVITKLLAKVNAPKKDEDTLYFYAYNYKWFVKEIKSHYCTQLRTWRSISVPFMRFYIQPFLGGKCLLKNILTLENKFPGFMGRFGAYPLWITVKE